MNNLDMGILSVVDRVMMNFAKSIKHRYVESDELRNELFVRLKEELIAKPLINNTANALFNRGMSIASGYTARVRRQSHIQDRLTDRGKKLSLFDLIKSRTDTLPADRKLTKELKLQLWGSTKNERWFKAIDSRLFAYLLLVEEWTMKEIADYFGYSWNRINTSIHQVTIKPEKYKVTLKKNDVVLLKMDNPFFNNMLGRVKEPTDYGALVLVESHSYPQRKIWELRCTNDEMVYIGSLDEKELINKVTSEAIPGSTKKVAHAADMGKYEVVYNHTIVTESKQQFSSNGELCTKCGGFLVRTGSCLTCQSCGSSSGGCG